LSKTQDKEAIFIFGKTGAGKSTLISFLIGFGFKKDKKKLVRLDNVNILAPEIG
jgi:type IV secretory pathway VirB4 component